MAPLTLAAGGTHGAELRYSDGSGETMGGVALGGVRALTKAFVGSRSGLVMEDKGAAIAIHYRHAPFREGEVARFLEDAVADHALMIQHGKMVAEVKSSLSSKGRAIEMLMAQPPFAGRIPLFIGDDLTDEHGFEAVNALNGIAIKVGGGHEPTLAPHRLHDPEDVRAFLRDICRSAELDQ